MNITTERRDWIGNQSKTLPVLGLLHSHHCVHCTRPYPSWAALANRYAVDLGVLIMQCENVNDRATCEATTKVNGSATFVIVHSGAFYRARIKQTPESFTKLIEDLKTLGPKVI
jgi:hypothetical protein